MQHNSYFITKKKKTLQIECEYVFQFISAENTFGIKSQFIQNAQNKTFKAQREHKLFAIKLQEIYGKAAVEKHTKGERGKRKKSTGKTCNFNAAFAQAFHT